MKTVLIGVLGVALLLSGCGQEKSPKPASANDNVFAKPFTDPPPMTGSGRAVDDFKKLELTPAKK